MNAAPEDSPTQKPEYEVASFSEVAANRPVSLEQILVSLPENLPDLSVTQELRKAEILPAHAPHQKYLLSRAELARIFEEKELSGNFIFRIPNQVVIEPILNYINPTEVQIQISHFLRENCLLPDCEIEVRNLQIPKFKSAKSSSMEMAKWTLDFSQARRKGAILIPIKFDFIDGSSETSWLKASVNEKRFAYVARRALKMGEILSSSDLERKWINTNFKEGAVLKESELQRQVLAHYVPAGEPIMYEDVRGVPDCQRGQQVRLISGSENLEVSIQATAEEPGTIGSIIKVKTLDTQKRLSAIIVDKGTVRLQ